MQTHVTYQECYIRFLIMSERPSSMGHPYRPSPFEKKTMSQSSVPLFIFLLCIIILFVCFILLCMLDIYEHVCATCVYGFNFNEFKHLISFWNGKSCICIAVYQNFQCSAFYIFALQYYFICVLYFVLCFAVFLYFIALCITCFAI